MTERSKLIACNVMSVVGLVIALDIIRIARVPKQPGRSVGKQIGPV